MADPVDELNHIYGGTYIRSKDGHVLYIRVFRYGRRNEIVIDYHNYTTSREEEAIPFVKEDYDFSFPTLGNINENTYAVYMSRVPLRQYKRSIAASNVRRDVIGANALECIGKRVSSGIARNTTETNNAIVTSFAPAYFSYNEALGLVTKGSRISAAFSANLAVCIEPTINVPALYYRTIFIGTAGEGAITLSKPALHLREQIQATLPEVNIT